MVKATGCSKLQHAKDGKKLQHTKCVLDACLIPGKRYNFKTY